MNKYGKTPAEVIGEFHPLFKGLTFVAAARSTEEERLVLCHVLVERQGLEYHLVATDGKRLHKHTMDDIEVVEPGLYEVIAKSSKYIVIAANDDLCSTKYPDWRKVVPSLKLKHEDSITSKNVSKLCITTGTLLATDYALQACGFGCGLKKDDHAHVHYAAHPDGGGFVIEHDLGTAVVMPLRMESGDNAEAKDEAEMTPQIPGLVDAVARFQKTLKDANASVEISVGDKVVEITKDNITAKPKE
jgi:hypothetical protein